MPPIRRHRSYGPDNPLVKRQVQVTTTVTPTLTRGAVSPVQTLPTQAASTPALTLTSGANTSPSPPVQTITRGSPLTAAPPQSVPAASPPPPPSSSIPRPPAASSTAAGDVDNDSIFPSNLTWWQILGIAIACVAVVSLLAIIVLRRRKRQRNVEKKEKEAKAEERREAREEAARLREETLPHRLMGMGMGMGGMGMGRMPMVLREGRSRGHRGRRRGRRRCSDSDSDDSWDSSGSESYDDLSDGGTIRKHRRRRPRRRKERGSRDRRRRRDRSDDDDPPSSAASSFYARPRKERPQRDRRKGAERARGTPTSSRSRGHDSAAKPSPEMPMGLGPPTLTAGTPYSGGSGQLGRKPSKRKTFRDSVFSTYDSMKRAAVRHKYMDSKVRMQKQLEEEEAIERQRQAKIREANDQLRREKEQEQRSLKQIAAVFAPAKRRSPEPVPDPATHSLHIPMPEPQPLLRQQAAMPHMQQPPVGQPTEEVETLIPPPRRQNSAPASAYNSALPEKQHPRPPKTSGSTSELPYAYDGVSSVRSSAAGRSAKPPRAMKPKVQRQDSDPPLKSAMRTPGVRRPERKLTINDKTSTIRPPVRAQTSESSYSSAQTSDFLKDWLSKPPLPGGLQGDSRNYTSESPSTATSVELSIPHPKDRPIIKRGGLAPAPPPRARTKSSASRSTLSSSTRSNHSSAHLLPGADTIKPDYEGGPANAGTPAGNKWANRLRNRR